MLFLLIGVGNEYRSDDAVGLFVARLAREGAPEQINVRESPGEGAALIKAWEGAQTVILIDAVCSGGEAGTIHRIEAHRETLPAKLFHYSTHAFGVAEAIELARVLNQLPPRLIVYGIEGKNFAAGVGLSPEVKEAAERVVDCVLKDLSREANG
jgi:hydrogenase maturation protease